MIDALLFAVLDTVREMGFGWGKDNSNVMADGHPAPQMGTWFLAVHQQPERGDMMNALDEYFEFALTLTARVDGVPLDRLGDSLLCSRLARTLAQEIGFNAKANQLKTFLHMNWYLLQVANDNLLKMESGAYVVNGFAEPAQWATTELPILVGGEWFGSDPEAPDVGVKAEIRFKNARRFQPIATFT